MKLLVVRHGAAMDKEEFAETGDSDDLRPLTEEGRAEIKSVAKGLEAEVDTPDVLATSPLVRARQTAEIIADAYGLGTPEVTRSILPDAPFEEFEKWCSDLGEKKVIAIVGHAPHLSTLVTWLLTGRTESRIRLKKGGACLLEFEAEVRKEAGTLNWLLTPRQLSRGSK
jgi:phosphohistidine phosphatase